MLRCISVDFAKKLVLRKLFSASRQNGTCFNDRNEVIFGKDKLVEKNG